jgi:hypothetical protein
MHVIRNRLHLFIKLCTTKKLEEWNQRPPTRTRPPSSSKSKPPFPIPIYARRRQQSRISNVVICKKFVVDVGDDLGLLGLFGWPGILIKRRLPWQAAGKPLKCQWNKYTFISNENEEQCVRMGHHGLGFHQCTTSSCTYHINI